MTTQMRVNDPPQAHTLRATPLSMGRVEAWPLVLALVAGYAAWLAGWYWETVVSMVSIWYRSETFAHGFLVFPVSLWLVWRQRRELARLRPEPRLAPVPLALIAGAALLWVVSDMGDVLAGRHFAWVTMLVGGIWLLTGKPVMRRLTFPLAFLYFAVPMGEFLLPTLIEWTADFTITALRASGVPVLRDGMTFHIPTGSWSVVEACSGLRYLIASLTVGVLYAYLSYRSLSRRVLFVGASIIVPIIANWLRAYMIVMIGHLSGNKLAVGIDHIIYGWIFFGLVMLLLFWVGSFWSEDQDAGLAAVDAGRGRPLAEPAGTPLRWRVPFAVALALTAAAPAALALLHDADNRSAIDTRAPALGAWQPIGPPSAAFVPEFTAPRAAIASGYAKGDARGGLYVALYYDQDRDSKLVSSRNQLLRTTSKIGHVISEGQRTVAFDDGPMVVDETVLRLYQQRVLARSWYWVDGAFTASPVRAKLRQAMARLAGRGDAGAIVVVWTPLGAGDEAAADAAGSAVLDDLSRQAASALRPLLAARLRAGHAP
jgi:exosortase A